MINNDFAADAKPTLPPPPPLVWNIAPPDPDAARSLAHALRLPPLLGQVLLNRGITDPEEAHIFLNPRLADLHDPYLLPDMEKAVARLADAIESKEKIFVHGDYDADGVTSTAIYLRALTALGANVVGFVPRRTDGYDLQNSGVDRAKETGATLILTADCGIRAVDPVEYARTLGIEVIVTDHHQTGSQVANAFAVVNPHCDGCAAPFVDLCGAGVAFKVMDALVARVLPAHRDAFRGHFLDLVALGTVSDMVNLVGENRILVAHGLRALSDGKKTGLRALLLSTDLVGRTLTTENISFTLGPRLNAAGRMGDADLAYRLLITKDPDEAEQLAVHLGALVERSREEAARVTTEALIDALSPEHENRRVLVLARERWGKGVVGVAATRIVEACHRPVILLSFDRETNYWHGSGRTFGSFNLHDALADCHKYNLLGRWGGHAASAGVSLHADHLEAVRDRLHDFAAGIIPDVPTAPALRVDAETDHNHIWTHESVTQMDRLGPFGRENAEPVFVTRDALVLEARRVGKDKNTFSATVRLPGHTACLKAVWFKNGDWADRLVSGDSVDIAYTPRINAWQGRVSVDLGLRDMRLSE